jgi:hypothetical protein
MLRQSQFARELANGQKCALYLFHDHDVAPLAMPRSTSGKKAILDKRSASHGTDASASFEKLMAARAWRQVR